MRCAEFGESDFRNRYRRFRKPPILRARQQSVPGRAESAHLIVEERQAEREASADLRSAVDFYRPVVIFNDFFRDVET